MFYYPRYSITFICPVFYSMLPVSLDCSCFITLSVFSNVYLSCVLSTCQFLWIVCYQFVLCLVSVLYVYSCQFLWIVHVLFLCPCCQFLWIVHVLVFYNIYLSCVLSTLCCQFLWIVHVLLPFRYSITFICPVSCLLYVASFSGLFMFYYPFGIL